MKTFTFLFLFLCLTSAVQAQSMFRGNAAHTGVYPGVAPREFHRVKWTKSRKTLDTGTGPTIPCGSGDDERTRPD